MTTDAIRPQYQEIPRGSAYPEAPEARYMTKLRYFDGDTKYGFCFTHGPDLDVPGLARTESERLGKTVQYTTARTATRVVEQTRDWTAADMSEQIPTARTPGEKVFEAARKAIGNDVKPYSWTGDK